MPNDERNLETMPDGALGLIPLESCKELGLKVDQYLVGWREKRQHQHQNDPAFKGYRRDSYIISTAVPRFGTGEAKGVIKESVRAIRNVRTSMNVPPSRKAKVFVVTEDADLTDIFENSRVFFSTLASASEVVIQKDKTGIGEDAVSAVIPKAAIYMPFAELVDIEKETERLKKEEERLTKELARVNGMLANEKFVSKAPAAKIEEEKAKQAKYSQMMEQVKERLAQLR